MKCIQRLVAVAQSLSCVQLFATPWTVALQSFLSITNFWSLLKLMSIKSVMASNHLILCRPLLLPSVFPSIGIFPSKSALPVRWLKYWIFSFSISPSNEHSGFISFRTDWFDLFAVQGTLKSFLQHHSMKFFGCQPSLWYNSHIHCCCSVTLCDPHGQQHARLPCPSLSPRVCSLVSIKSVMPPNYLILCCPLLLLPSIFPSIRI